MADSNQIEQAVSRTLRDSLGRIQGASEELSQAINDLVSACASSRPANALPSMVRAQTSAASLSAALEILSRFVTSALQPATRSALEQDIALGVSRVTGGLITADEQPPLEPQHLKVESPGGLSVMDAATVVVPQSPDISRFEAPDLKQEPPAEQFSSGPVMSEAVLQPVEEMPPAAEMPPAVEPVFLNEPEPVFAQEPAPEPSLQVEPVPESSLQAEAALEPVAEMVAAQQQPIFDVAKLPEEERELHKRAYRVAKVSMQDIVMLHPEDIRLGRENKDLCFRLRDDIEKAHREYGRRFQSIYNHPVDYFYDWMVEILAAGHAEALGEYPYPSPVLRR